MQNIFKNYPTLAISDLRKDAMRVLAAGMEVLDIEKIIKQSVSIHNQSLRIMHRRFDLDKYKRILVIGIGKCAFKAAAALEKILGPRIVKGIVLDVAGKNLKK